MKIDIEPEELSRLETFIERCRSSNRTNTFHKFSDEDDKFVKRMAKRFRRELKDYYKSTQQLK